MRKVSLFESELGPFERICSIHQLELAFRAPCLRIVELPSVENRGREDRVLRHEKS